MVRKKQSRKPTKEEQALQQANLENQIFPNIAATLSEEVLQKLGNQAVEGYNTDLESVQPFYNRVKKWLKLFGTHTDPKSFPWPNASNVALPIITIACTQFQARSVENILPSKNIVKVFPLKKSQAAFQSAERVSTHMNYQTMFQMREFKKGMDKSLMQLPLVGTILRKTFYDATKQRPVSDFVSVTDFVVNYYTRYLEDSERCTHVLKQSRNEIRKREAIGFYRPTDLTLQHNIPKEPEQSQVKQEVDKQTGQEQTDSEDLNPRIILEQHVDLIIPTKVDNTSPSNTKPVEIKLPYILHVDLETRQILRISLRLNPRTGKRMDFFTKTEFLPNADGGFFGIGFGHLLENINQTSNTLLNQLTDAGTLANTTGGFVLKRSGMRRGDISFGMGQYNEVDLRTDDIRKAIFPMSFKEPSQVLFQLLGLLQVYADRVTTVSEVMSGALPRSDTPATGIAAAVEQGLKIFSTIHKRVHDSFGDELQKLFDINALHLNEQEYFSLVLNEDTAFLQSPEALVQEAQVARTDYLIPLNVVPVSDPNIVSKTEKIQKAQAVYDLALSNPISANNIQAITAAYKNLLNAFEINDVLADIISTPQQPQEPPDISQPEEIRNFFSERYVQVLPQQDHEEHLAVIEEFRQSTLFPEMSPTAKRLLEQHTNEHLGFLAQLELEAREQLAQQQLQQQVQQQGGV